MTNNVIRHKPSVIGLWSRRGQLSLELLVVATITLIFISGFSLWASSFINLSLRDFNKGLAFSIAEAGIEYYRWHLAHAPTDYQDGTGGPGPYVHPYYDKNGVEIGAFTLEITPPPAGSTIVMIRSTGTVKADASIRKIIEVKMGITSFAKYAVAVNDNVRFGESTVAYGEIMANGGIRFDGLAYNLVKSAQSSYDDPDHGGQNEFGVHTHKTTVDPLPPAAVPSRPDVFVAGRQFPVPAVDFAGITQDLAGIKTAAIASSTYYASSSASGYDLELKTDGTYNLYKVTTVSSTPNGCTNVSNQSGWGTWSVQAETLHATGQIPQNGVIFVEDHLWVRGQINGKRVTIASGRFPDNPSTRTSITVNSDLRYTNYDGTDAIALIAQNNFNVGLYSADVLRIDAALMAQNGRTGRYYYQPPNNQNNNNRCGLTVVRQKITLYGMIGSNLRYGFGYTDVTGYLEREIIYDANLLYGPPPSFPLAGDQYVQISWKEVQ